jgi:hypothetical protein
VRVSEVPRFIVGSDGHGTWTQTQAEAHMHLCARVEVHRLGCIHACFININELPPGKHNTRRACVHEFLNARCMASVNDVLGARDVDSGHQITSSPCILGSGRSRSDMEDDVSTGAGSKHVGGISEVTDDALSSGDGARVDVEHRNCVVATVQELLHKVLAEKARATCRPTLSGLANSTNASWNARLW